MLIPDPCYYHTHQPNVLIELLYEFSAGEGFHPFPSMFNFILTIGIGCVLGFIVTHYLLGRRNLKRGST